MDQKALFGAGISGKLEELVRGYNPQKILLVRGKKSFEECGASTILSKALLGMSIIEFCDFQDNPKIDDVYKGLKLMKNNNIDLIIGIGGGSVMDMAKLIRFLNSYNTNENFSIHTKKGDLKPLILLPTTAGTGAEATHFAVLYKNKKKYSLEHVDVLSDVAIVDPIFTYNNPKYLTACSGIDALSQAIESFWNINANEESDEYAKKAIKLLFKNLKKAVNNPTNEVRNSLSEGAYWAGRAINITKTTAPHAFSYPFTTYYGIPHGHAVSLTLPKFMEINYGKEQIQMNGKLDIDLHHKKMDYLYSELEIKNISTAYSQMKHYIVDDLHLSVFSSFDKKLILDDINIQRLNNNPIMLSYSEANLIVESLMVSSNYD